jgi:hypothetical protein
VVRLKPRAKSLNLVASNADQVKLASNIRLRRSASEINVVPRNAPVGQLNFVGSRNGISEKVMELPGHESPISEALEEFMVEMDL